MMVNRENADSRIRSTISLHLVALQAGLVQHVNHADYAIHRGADLMAHRGEKAGFCFVGQFGITSSMFKICHDARPFADVAQDAGEITFSLDEVLADCQIQRNRLAVLMHPLDFAPDADDARLAGAAIALDIAVMSGTVGVLA